MAKTVPPIKRWSPKHELVVQLSIGTMSQEAIAEHTGFTLSRIRQIVADPQARKIVDEFLQHMRAKAFESIEGGLIELTEHAVKRIAQTLTYEDFVLGTDAKKHQDNLSLGLLKGAGFLGVAASNREESGDLRTPLNEALSTRLIEAVEAAQKAEDTWRGKKEIVVKDADFKLVEKESSNGTE